MAIPARGGCFSTSLCLIQHPLMQQTDGCPVCHSKEHKLADCQSQDVQTMVRMLKEVVESEGAALKDNEDAPSSWWWRWRTINKKQGTPGPKRCTMPKVLDLSSGRCSMMCGQSIRRHHTAVAFCLRCFTSSLARASTSRRMLSFSRTWIEPEVGSRYLL